MKPIISIIIPVYNVEKYLKKCIESCISQTLSNIEIIIINDCSPDNCDKIMHEYELRYPELIKCIYLKENIKQGGARNRGLEIAQGEYILFVDSDDYIAEDMCEKMYKSAMFNDADIVICDYFRVSDNNKFIRTSLNIKIESVENISKDFLLEHRINQGVLCKLYRRKLFANTKFLENVYHEDLPFTLVWILNANKINYISIPLYYYVSREDSVMCKTDYNTKLQYANAIACLIDNLKKAKLFEKYYKPLCKNILKEINDFICIYIMQFLDRGLKELENLIKAVNENIPDWNERIKNEESFLECEKNIIYNFLSNSNYDEELLQRHNIELNKLFRNNKVAIWGGGVYGKNLMEYTSKYNIRPMYIIDSNTNLHGSYLNDILVTSIDKISDKCDIVIVTIKDKGIFEEIREEVDKKNKKIKVIYFQELFKV